MGFINIIKQWYKVIQNVRKTLISFNFSHIFNKFKDLNVNKLLIKCLQNLIIVIHKLY